MINCRECKTTLVKYLSQYFLRNVQMYMQDCQTPYVAGGFDEPITNTAWYIRAEGETILKQPNPAYTCNAAETDTRLWLHVKKSSSTTFLVFSPDTDVYHVGLPLQCDNKKVIVQISSMT